MSPRGRGAAWQTVGQGLTGLGRSLMDYQAQQTLEEERRLERERRDSMDQVNRDLLYAQQGGGAGDVPTMEMEDQSFLNWEPEGPNLPTEFQAMEGRINPEMPSMQPEAEPRAPWESVLEPDLPSSFSAPINPEPGPSPLRAGLNEMMPAPSAPQTPDRFFDVPEFEPLRVNDPDYVPVGSGDHRGYVLSNEARQRQADERDARLAADARARAIEHDEEDVQRAIDALRDPVSQVQGQRASEAPSDAMLEIIARGGDPSAFLQPEPSAAVQALQFGLDEGVSQGGIPISVYENGGTSGGGGSGAPAEKPYSIPSQGYTVAFDQAQQILEESARLSKSVNERMATPEQAAEDLQYLISRTAWADDPSAVENVRLFLSSFGEKGRPPNWDFVTKLPDDFINSGVQRGAGRASGANTPFGKYLTEQGNTPWNVSR